MGRSLCGQFDSGCCCCRAGRLPPCARAHALTHTLTPSLAPFSLPSLLSTPLRVSGLLTVRVADRYVGEFCTAHSTQHTAHRPQHTSHNSLSLSPPLYLSSLSLPPPRSPPRDGHYSQYAKPGDHKRCPAWRPQKGARDMFAEPWPMSGTLSSVRIFVRSCTPRYRGVIVVIFGRETLQCNGGGAFS